MQIAVLGNDEFVTGFRLSGISHVFSSEDRLDAKVEEALGVAEIGVLVMEEAAFSTLNNKTKKRLERIVKPVVVTISGKGKETNLREMIKRSIGVDLWK